MRAYRLKPHCPSGGNPSEIILTSLTRTEKSSNNCNNKICPLLYIYIYIYIYMCVCVCVCVCMYACITHIYLYIILKGHGEVNISLWYDESWKILIDWISITKTNRCYLPSLTHCIITPLSLSSYIYMCIYMSAWCVCLCVYTCSQRTGIYGVVIVVGSRKFQILDNDAGIYT